MSSVCHNKAVTVKDYTLEYATHNYQFCFAYSLHKQLENMETLALKAGEISQLEHLMEIFKIL